MFKRFIAIVRILQESWAWSPTEGVTRQPLSGLVSYVIDTGIPQRAGPISLPLGMAPPNADKGTCSPLADLPGGSHACAQATCDTDGQNETSCAAWAFNRPYDPGSVEQSGRSKSDNASSWKCRHAASGTAKHAARLYRSKSDSIGHVAPRFLLLVPVLGMYDRTRASGRPGAEVVAVLKLLNKCASQDGMFSFADEVLVQAMARHAAPAFQMAQYESQAFCILQCSFEVDTGGEPRRL